MYFFSLCGRATPHKAPHLMRIPSVCYFVCASSKSNFFPSLSPSMALSLLFACFHGEATFSINPVKSLVCFCGGVYLNRTGKKTKKNKTHYTSHHTHPGQRKSIWQSLRERPFPLSPSFVRAEHKTPSRSGGFSSFLTATLYSHPVHPVMEKACARRGISCPIIRWLV